MGPTEWIGLAVPLSAWTVMFTVLGIVTFRENRRDRACRRNSHTAKERARVRSR